MLDLIVIGVFYGGAPAIKKKKKKKMGEIPWCQWQEMLIRALSEAVKNGAVAARLIMPGEIKKLITCCLLCRSTRAARSL